MPKRIILTDEQEEWLVENCDSISYAAQARYIGCHPDTLKRILMRRGLAYFEGAKFVVALSDEEETWNRPCSGCGCTKKRPKWIYYCDDCRRELGWDDNESDESWYGD